jgi:hypothetical protein
MNKGPKTASVGGAYLLFLACLFHLLAALTAVTTPVVGVHAPSVVVAIGFQQVVSKHGVTGVGGVGSGEKV